MIILLKSKYSHKSMQISLTPSTENTTITIEPRNRYTFICQNDEAIAAVPNIYPFMSIVRTIRKAIPNIKMNVR